MKKIVSLVIFCLLPVLCFAQLRNQVCIVRPNYSETLVQDLRNFAPRLSKLGIENPEEQITNFFTKGSSGSGFVYVAPDGKNYIITNRHVISDANTASIVFQNETGQDVKTFIGLKILAASADLDLAILVFPNDERPFDSGFQFYDDRLSDGKTVFTAGYPGLLGTPVWQFGSGIITNGYANVPEMILPEYSSVIQHSAQVDSGNSGGPLLVKTSDDKYLVAGVNTWKISNRQDASFAIPAKTVMDFISKVLEGEYVPSKTPEEAILEQAQELQKVLNKFNVTYEELTNYISIDFIEQEGKAIFDYTYDRCDEKNRTMFKEMLINYSPIMCMRYAIAWYIFQEFHKNEYKTDVSQKQSVKKLPEVPVPVQCDDSDIWYTAFYLSYTKSYARNEWKYTNGGWELYSFKNVSFNRVDVPNSRMGKKSEKKSINSKSVLNKKNEKFVREIPEGKIFYTPNLISASISLPPLYFSNDMIYPQVVDLEVKLLDILAVDVTGILIDELENIYYEGQNYYDIESVGALAGLQLQLPFTKNHFILMPYLTVQGGAKFSDWSNFSIIPVVRGEAGGRMNFFLGRSKSTFFLDVNYQILMDFENFSPDHNLMLSVGISY